MELIAHDKNNSNVVKESKTDYILNHEQRHFDLSFIYAMKFVDELKKQPTLTLDDIDIIYNKIFNEWTTCQNQYDMETKNSVNKEMQTIWDEKISGQLNKLKLNN